MYAALISPGMAEMASLFALECSTGKTPVDGGTCRLGESPTGTGACYSGEFPASGACRHGLVEGCPIVGG